MRGVLNDALSIYLLDATLERYLSPAERRSKPAGRDFQKVVAGRKLWNFDKREWKIWQEAL